MPQLSAQTVAQMVQQALTDHGFEAYLVGGAVRDTLLGRPAHDWDVTTNAAHEDLVALGFEVKLVGAHFGVSLVELNGFTVECAQFRTDGSYSDNRHPDSVSFTRNVTEDVMRRDFTVNALLMDQHGTVVDHVGGLADLESRTLRTVGDPVDRFGEDALRMLRAVRFCAQLDFAMHPHTFAAVMQLAHTVRSVSAERVATELTKMLTSGRADLAMHLLRSTGLSAHVLPEYDAMHGVDQGAANHPEGDVMRHTNLLLAGLTPGCDPALAWAALLHDVGKPATAAVHPRTGQPTFYGHEDVGAVMATTVLNRFRFANDFVDTVTSMVAQHMKFFHVREMKLGKLKQFVRQPNFDLLLQLHRLDVAASNGDFSTHQYCVDFLAATPAEMLAPTRLLTGTDLLALGYAAGPAFKTVLAALELAQLDGTVTDRATAESFVAQQWAATHGETAP